MADQIQTTWMWHDDASNGVKGAIVDLDTNVIQWIDQPGCACGDNAQPQSIDDFLEKGSLVHVPADILDEMHTELTRFVRQIAES